MKDFFFGFLWFLLGVFLLVAFAWISMLALLPFMPLDGMQKNNPLTVAWLNTLSKETLIGLRVASGFWLLFATYTVLYLVFSVAKAFFNAAFGAAEPAPEARSLNLANSGKANNRAAVAGFCLGLTSILFFWIGLIPILGVVFSAIGLGTFDATRQKNRWMAGWGLGVSVVYTLIYMRDYGHLVW